MSSAAVVTDTLRVNVDNYSAYNSDIHFMICWRISHYPFDKMLSANMIEDILASSSLLNPL